MAIILAPTAYVFYGYSKYEEQITPKQNSVSYQFVVIKPPSTNYIVISAETYLNLTKNGNLSLPLNSKAYAITVIPGITGNLGVDMNLTFRSKYERFTIVLGSPDVKVCSSNPKMFIGSCSDRTAAVVEITAMISNIFKGHYYQEALAKGMDTQEAQNYAHDQVTRRYGTNYLSFFTKSQIGLGNIGNKQHLAVILRGPAEGAEENRIIIPRLGLVVLEGKTDDALRAEVALIEHIIGFKWPTENQTSTSG